MAVATQSMTDEQRKSVAIEYLKAFDKGGTTSTGGSILDLFADDAQVYFPKWGVASGKDEIGTLFGDVGGTLDRIVHHSPEFNWVFSGSDVVVCEGTSHGEHRDGPWRAGVPEWGAGSLVRRVRDPRLPDPAGLHLPRPRLRGEGHRALPLAGGGGRRVTTAWTADEMMTVAAARHLANGEVCFVGIGLPSTVANLARRTHAPELVLVYESGTHRHQAPQPSRCRSATASWPRPPTRWCRCPRSSTTGSSRAHRRRLPRRRRARPPGRHQHDRHRPVRRPRRPAAGRGRGARDRGVVRAGGRHRPSAAGLRRAGRVPHLAGLRRRPARAELGLRDRGPTVVITDLGVLERDPVTGELVLTDLHPGSPSSRPGGHGLGAGGRRRAGRTAPPTDEELAALRELGGVTVAAFTYEALPGGWCSAADGVAGCATSSLRLGADRVLLVDDARPRRGADSRPAGRPGGRPLRRGGPARARRAGRAGPGPAGDVARADAVVSVGGGSATGLGKAIALTHDVPIVAVPTTYAGSEMTTIYGLTDARTSTPASRPS